MAGNLQSVTQPDGLTTTYTYDALNRLDLEEVRDSGNQLIAHYDYHLRADGLRDSVLEQQLNPDGSFSDVRVSYTYDADGRLTGETHDQGANGPDSSDLTLTYAFDLANNRVKQVIDQGSDGSADETILYAYNGNDELLSEASTLSGGAHDKSYAYDANGSTTEVTTSAGTVHYAWDLRNRMVGLDANGDGDLSDSGDASYGYDSQGQRVSQSAAGGTTTDFLNDKLSPSGYPQILEERQGATLTRSYVLGLRVEGQSDANGLFYFVRDGHGSDRLLVNADGTITQRYDYQAFGEALGFDPSAALTSQLFAGDAEFDPVSGLYYHDQRWRQEGRFLSADTYAGSDIDPASLHKYLYANGNPLSNVDPSGQSPITELLVVTGILGALVGLEVVIVGSLVKTGHNLILPGAIPITANNVPFLDKQYAELAADAYNGIDRARAYPGWRLVDPSELELTRSMFISGNFKAVLYQSGQSYVLSFKGTESSSGQDWYTDIAQGLFGQLLPTEYDNALRVARAVSAAVGGKSLTMVGHSLGGGLADAAAFATNRNAVTFNAAGLNPITESNNNSGSYSKTMIN